MNQKEIQELRELADALDKDVDFVHSDAAVKALRACADEKERAQAGSGDEWVLIPREAGDQLAFHVSQCFRRDLVLWKDAYQHMLRVIERDSHPPSLQSAALALQGDRPNASGISRGMAAELAEREATEHADAMSPYRDRRWDDVWLQEFAESYVERVTPLGTPQAIAADLSRAIGDSK